MASAAVVDTNILVSALLRPGSMPSAVVEAIEQLRLVPVVCAQTASEYAKVLRRPRFAFDTGRVQTLLTLIEQLGRWVDITPMPATLALPDASDWPFIACALATGCPVITGNAKHFPISSGVVVVTAAQWVAARASG